MLEPCEVKVSRRVLKGLGTGNGPRLPGERKKLGQIELSPSEIDIDSVTEEASEQRLALSPEQLKTCSLLDFSNGRLAPAVVIEMGLNYKEGHLSHDAEKLLNSQFLHGYLVHLVRGKPHETGIDETICRLREEGTIKVAFARVESGRKFIKLLDDREIREM